MIPKHMNHGPQFQALWKRLREEVRQLQNRGYYGDGKQSVAAHAYSHANITLLPGYWSSGQRLADSATIPGDGIDVGEFPEYMVGLYVNHIPNAYLTLIDNSAEEPNSDLDQAQSAGVPGGRLEKEKRWNLRCTLAGRPLRSAKLVGG